MSRALVDPSRYPVIAKIVVLAAIVGGIFGFFLGNADLRSIAQGGVTGALVSGLIAFAEYALLRSRAGEQILRSRFIVHVGAKTVIYLAAVIVGVLTAEVLFGDVSSGRRLALFVGISFGISLVFNFVMTLGALLGPGVLVSFLTGRYHVPREERRVFLFVDMEGSTAQAERLGSVKFHKLLRRFIYDVGDAVQVSRGEIHKYVGDEAIVTWPEAEVADGRAIDCVRLIRDAIARNAERYRREFGVVPGFRAALHGGTVVAGEIGGWKQEIAYIGDVVNTTARIAEACRSVGRHVLISRTTLASMRLPEGWRGQDIGPTALRGKVEPVDLVALETA